MTTAATITALEALTADALRSADDAQLARLRELSTALVALVENERDRRNPTDTELEEAVIKEWITSRTRTQKGRVPSAT